MRLEYKDIITLHSLVVKKMMNLKKTDKEYEYYKSLNEKLQSLLNSRHHI